MYLDEKSTSTNLTNLLHGLPLALLKLINVHNFLKLWTFINSCLTTSCLTRSDLGADLALLEISWSDWRERRQHCTMKSKHGLKLNHDKCTYSLFVRKWAYTCLSWIWLNCICNSRSVCKSLCTSQIKYLLRCRLQAQIYMIIYYILNIL